MERKMKLYSLAETIKEYAIDKDSRKFNICAHMLFYHVRLEGFELIKLGYSSRHRRYTLILKDKFLYS